MYVCVCCISLIICFFCREIFVKKRCATDYVEIVTAREDSDEQSTITSEANDEATLISGSSSQRHRARYCGDWSAKIKLLQRIDNYIAVRIKTADNSQKIYKGFRAEVRLLKKSKQTLPNVNERTSPSSIIDDDKYTPNEHQRYFCDNQWFTFFRGNCYLISNYPEVTWFTARRICADVEAQLLFIRNASDERTVVDLFRSATYQTNNDLERHARLYWLHHSVLAVGGGLRPSVTSHGDTGWPHDDDEWFKDVHAKEINPELAHRATTAEPNHEHKDEIGAFSVTNIKARNLQPKSSITAANLVDLPCVAISPVHSDQKRIQVERLQCTDHAGYICVKKPLGKFELIRLLLINAFFRL